MVTEIPSFVGYHPDEAKAAATALGLRVAWLEGAPPRWLSEHHEQRIGRPRMLEDGTLELLVVLVPSIVVE